MSAPALVEIPVGFPFSLSDTLKSGQLFHWEPLFFQGFDGFSGCIGNAEPSWVAQPEPGHVLTLKNHEDQVRRYFGLDQDLAEIHASFPAGDAVLADAIAYCPGIRVARQPLWECLATFITSSLKQVSHIRAMSLTLRERYGVEHEFEGRSFFSYPEPLSLAEAGEGELRKCALGYRAKSLALAAQAIVEGRIDLAAIEAEQDPEVARVALMELHGVGEKIANCVLLFSCAHWSAFPIDVWIERILREHYRKRIKGPKLQSWAMRYFGSNAGYAQQYLFHFARKTL